ncbi:IS30 family transposase [Actinoplanes xinjiangensis]|uniref:IS30 family transposase n=1 Tax=Actinoplanes xinjiangensis TaxID=512350 RepID=UPI0034342A83
MPITHSRQKRREFWDAIRSGLLPQPAAVAVGVAPNTGQSWFRQAGGVINNGQRQVGGRYLSFAEREEIACGLAARDSIRAIAARLGRAPSSVSREIARNSDSRGVYRAWRAEEQATGRARRPKTAKLAAGPVLRTLVQQLLTERWSPEQISLRLRTEFPDDESMRVSHETIYQSLYVQGRGALRRELAACLRTGRALRKPHRHAEQRRSRITSMVNISERPAEADDRAVPGHWEGDLIIGKDNKSAIGTLVERATRFCLLVHLPHGRDATAVRDAMIPVINSLPQQLRRSLTWDQGIEMARHTEISTATDLDIYFCDPHSPWQRGSNENTNGLLRQYFPKGTDLAAHTAEHLTAVAAQLNGRPRKTLNIRTPAEALTQLLINPPAKTPPVATTP